MNLQAIIGNLLRIGVFTALALVLLGLVAYILQHPGAEAGYGDFYELPFDFASWFSGLLQLKGESIMALGIMCLVATPFLRVVVSVRAFYSEGDRLYVFIGLTVLIIIVVSMLIGATE